MNLAKRNPGATFGLAAIMAVCYGVVYALTQILVNRANSGGYSLPFAGLYPVSIFVQLVTTGMLTNVFGRGVLGRKIGISEAWRTSRIGWVLLAALLLLLVDVAGIAVVVALAVTFAAAGLTGAAVAVGLLGGILALVAYILTAVRLSLTMPSVVLEGLGPWQAMKRSWRLSRGSFWRLFGIKLLTLLIITIATLVIEVPFELLVGVGTTFTVGGGSAPSGSLAHALVLAVAGIIALTLMQPLKSGTTVLLYLDLRMRREGLDLVLRNAAQSQQLTGDEFATIWRPPPPGQWQPAAAPWQQPAAGPWQPQWPAQGPPAPG